MWRSRVIGGENNQWDPALYDGTTPVEPPATPEEGYHLTEDLADRRLWMREQKALMPDKPFFVYFARVQRMPRITVPKEWADKYAGAFADGWDVQRERTFRRQKELGVVPADAELTARHDEIPAWDEMPDEAYWRWSEPASWRCTSVFTQHCRSSTSAG